MVWTRTTARNVWSLITEEGPRTAQSAKVHSARWMRALRWNIRESEGTVQRSYSLITGAEIHSARWMRALRWNIRDVAAYHVGHGAKVMQPNYWNAWSAGVHSARWAMNRESLRVASPPAYHIGHLSQRYHFGRCRILLTWKVRRSMHAAHYGRCLKGRSSFCPYLAP